MKVKCKKCDGRGSHRGGEKCKWCDGSGQYDKPDPDGGK